MDKRKSLRALTNEYARTNFCWGVHDCCQFVAQHITNVLQIKNPAFDYHYQTEIGAQDYLDSEGGVEGICTKVLGEPCETNALAIGDVCLVNLPISGKLLGICAENGAIVTSEKGLLKAPVKRILKGWNL